MVGDESSQRSVMPVRYPGADAEGVISPMTLEAMSLKAIALNQIKVLSSITSALWSEAEGRCEFKASLCYIERPHLQTKKQI